jgi:iron(III) transport system permease protein
MKLSIFLKLGGFWALIASIAFMLFILTPIGIVFFQSFTTARFGLNVGFTLKNYQDALNLSAIMPVMFNSFTYAIGCAILGTTVGAMLAWIVARTNTPGKSLIEILPLYPILMPPIAKTIAWITLLAPRSGILNNTLDVLTGTKVEPFNAFSIPALIWVFGLTLVPLAYLTMLPVLLNFDPALEESAYVCSSGPLRTLLRITFPLTFPAFLSIFILNLLRGLRSFTTPALMGSPGGIEVFITKVYDAVELNQNPGLATAYSSILIVIIVAIVLVYIRTVRVSQKYATVSGRGYHPHIIDIGRWKYFTLGFVFVYFAVGILIPFVTLIILALIPNYSFDAFVHFTSYATLDSFNLIFSDPTFVSGFYNSLGLSAAAAAIGVMLAAVVAFVVHRVKSVGTKVFEIVGTLPIGLPDLILSLGFLILFINTPLYNTIWLLAIALTVAYFPFALRSTSASILSIKDELEEAAWVHGGKWRHVFMRVTLPLLKPGLAAAFFFIFTDAMRSIEAVVLLTSPGSTFGPVTIFDYFNIGNWSPAAAGCVVYLVVLITVITVAKYTLKIRFVL